MEIITSFFLTLIAGLSTCLGYLFVYLKPYNINRFICISLSFAVGVMSLISIKELLPYSISYIVKNFNIINSLLLLIVIPIIIYLFFNSFTKMMSKSPSLYRVGVLAMISLMLHNIPEGIITFLASYSNLSIGFKLILGIMAHNVPEGILIAVPIYYATKNKKKAFINTFIAGISESFGALIVLIFKNIINQSMINILLYIVGCLMIIISIKEIIPEIIKYKNIYYILVGILLSLIILII